MNHALRADEPVFVIVSVSVSGSSVHVLPLPDELMYVVGQLMLHIVACLLSKELVVWPMVSVALGASVT